jgi:hypothetical protein
MGVGSNPAAWFVVIASILIVSKYFNIKKETFMGTQLDSANCICKSQAKLRVPTILNAIADTTLAITTDMAAWLATLSIH